MKNNIIFLSFIFITANHAIFSMDKNPSLKDFVVKNTVLSRIVPDLWNNIQKYVPYEWSMKKKDTHQPKSIVMMPFNYNIEMQDVAYLRQLEVEQDSHTPVFQCWRMINKEEKTIAGVGVLDGQGLLCSYPCHDKVEAICTISDGTKLFIGCGDVLRIYNVRHNQLIEYDSADNKDFKKFFLKKQITALSSSPDDKYLAVGCSSDDDKTHETRIYDIATKTCPVLLKHDGKVIQLRYSLSGRVLAIMYRKKDMFDLDGKTQHLMIYDTLSHRIERFCYEQCDHIGCQAVIAGSLMHGGFEIFGKNCLNSYGPLSYEYAAKYHDLILEQLFLKSIILKYISQTNKLWLISCDQQKLLDNIAHAFSISKPALKAVWDSLPKEIQEKWLKMVNESGSWTIGF